MRTCYYYALAFGLGTRHGRIDVLYGMKQRVFPLTLNLLLYTAATISKLPFQSFSSTNSSHASFSFHHPTPQVLSNPRNPSYPIPPHHIRLSHEGGFPNPIYLDVGDTTRGPNSASGIPWMFTVHRKAPTRIWVNVGESRIFGLTWLLRWFCGEVVGGGGFPDLMDRGHGCLGFVIVYFIPCRAVWAELERKSGR